MLAMGTDAEMSMRRGASFPAGAATPIGLAPSLGSAPKVGRTPTPPLEAVMQMPTMSCRAASMAKWPHRSQVAAVGHADHAGAEPACLFHCQLHEAAAYGDSQGAVSVDGGGGRRFLDDAPVGLRIEGAVAELLHVAAQHVDSVALYAAQVGGDEHLGGISGVVIGKASRSQYGGCGCPEGSGGHSYTVSVKV